MRGVVMVEQEVQVKMSAGTCDSILIAPGEGRSFPGVLFLTDIHGLRPAPRGMARRLAEVGFTVLMPNIFYRTSKPPVFDFPFRSGEERSMKRYAELTGPLTPEAIEQDAADYVGYLSSQSSVSQESMGAVGYCYSGALALRAAAACPDRIRAVASFHGGRLYTDSPTSPHRVLPRVRAQLYFGHASEDRGMPQEAIEKFNHALETWGGKYESEVYEGAHHGWTVPDSQAYDEPQAERAFEKLTSLFVQTLK
jgi:carboxymethylenebutenolidase